MRPCVGLPQIGQTRSVTVGAPQRANLVVRHRAAVQSAMISRYQSMVLVDLPVQVESLRRIAWRHWRTASPAARRRRGPSQPPRPCRRRRPGRRARPSPPSVVRLPDQRPRRAGQAANLLRDPADGRGDHRKPGRQGLEDRRRERSRPWPRGGTGRRPGKRRPPRPDRSDTGRTASHRSRTSRSARVAEGQSRGPAPGDRSGGQHRGSRHGLEVLEHVPARTVGGEHQDVRTRAAGPGARRASPWSAGRKIVRSTPFGIIRQPAAPPSTDELGPIHQPLRGGRDVQAAALVDVLLGAPGSPSWRRAGMAG